LEGDVVYKLFYLNGGNLLVRITPDTNTFVVEVLNRLPTEPELTVITQYIREWFDLDTDLTPFYAMARNDKLLSPIVEKFYGYRIVGQPDLFESLVWAIIGQQINLTFAYSLKQRFVEMYGISFEWNGRKYYSFPKPEVVANLTHDDLYPLQFSRQKSLYVQLIADAFVQGVVSKEKLKGLPLDMAKEQLMRIKGIGNWTANYALMKTFHYPDAFPLEDAGVHNAIRTLKKMKQKPTLDQVRRVFKKYKGWEAYATLYLWKTLTGIFGMGLILGSQ
jgi:DNA-3-methyladenine glycosylase II